MTDLGIAPPDSKLPTELLNTFDKMLQETINNNADIDVPKPKAVTKCSVQEAIQWASCAKELQCESSFVHNTNQTEANETGKPRHSGHLQVLITGSLFLVGAALQILDPDLALNLSKF